MAQIPSPTVEVSASEFATTALQELGIETYASTLIDSWTNIGESEATQQKYVSELVSSIRALLDDAVQAADQRKEDITSRISRKRENIDNLKAELVGAMDTEAVKIPGDEATLIDQINTIEAVEVQLLEERQKWVDTLSAKRDQAQEMCEQLGLDYDAKLHEIGPLTPGRVSDFDQYIGFLKETQDERRQVISDKVNSIKHYWSVLESTPTSHLEKSIVDSSCDLGVHIEVIEALRQMENDLHIEFRSREAETAELGREIQHLWDLLQVDEAFQAHFSEKHDGIGLSSVEACRDERQRLLILKEKMLPRIIGHERALISGLFESTSCDEVNQKKLFPAFAERPEVEDESYLETLKGYTAKLEARFEGLQPILSRIERRRELVAEREEYQALISDPNRLKSRSSGLTQLKENEMRIRVEKKLPKLESILATAVAKWEKENETTLMIDESPFLETMRMEQKAHEEDEKQRRQTRTEQLKLKKKVRLCSSVITNNEIVRC